METGISLHRGPAGDPGGKAPLLGTLTVMPSKALEMGISFHTGPVLGNIGDAPFLRVKFLFIRRPFIEEFARYVIEGYGNGQLSP